jgi:transcriptional regulator with XRE-family HTH domain
MSESIKAQWVEMRATVAKSGLTQFEVARAAGVSQPAVSRLMANCPKRHGAAFKNLCNYADSQRAYAQTTLPLPVDDAALVSAIREVWNGTPEHAQALAAMIRAAGAAARIAMV